MNSPTNCQGVEPGAQREKRLACRASIAGIAGQIRWAVYGGIAIAAGIALLHARCWRSWPPGLLGDEAFKNLSSGLKLQLFPKKSFS